MKTHVFVIFCLTLTSGWLFFYQKLRVHFSGAKQYRALSANLQDQVEYEEFKNRVLKAQMFEYKQHVAALLPGAIKKKGYFKEASYPLRGLASISAKSSGEHQLVSKSRKLFLKAKAKFKSADYEAASKSFLKLNRDFSYSPYIVESYFLLSESYYQLGQLDLVVQTVGKMVDLFPENELTGYSMLRLGKIYEFQERKEDALNIYKTVLDVFPQRGIASQARQSIRSVEL